MFYILVKSPFEYVSASENIDTSSLTIFVIDEIYLSKLPGFFVSETHRCLSWQLKKGRLFNCS